MNMDTDTRYECWGHGKYNSIGIIGYNLLTNRIVNNIIVSS